MSNRTKGILCIIASAFCFALMSTFVRLSGDLPSVQKSFFRNFVAMFICRSIFCIKVKGNITAVFSDLQDIKIFYIRSIIPNFI